MDEEKGAVVIDAEWLLNCIEAIEKAINDIRARAAEGVFVKPTHTNINLQLIDWRTKGGEPAGEHEPWAWAFAYGQDGALKDETRQLVKDIQRSGKVQVDGYEITLGGRDKNLLNRRRLNHRSR
jgi:hypothetical protein